MNYLSTQILHYLMKQKKSCFKNHIIIEEIWASDNGIVYIHYK